jgi:hypothetical protein
MTTKPIELPVFWPVGRYGVADLSGKLLLISILSELKKAD